MSSGRQIKNQDPQAAYHRGYSKAANKARAKLHTLRAAYNLAFDRIRNLAEKGIGTCSGCHFWTRHGTAQWGACDMSQATYTTHPSWPAPWANVECDKATCPGKSRMATHQSFGCINHLKAGEQK